MNALMEYGNQVLPALTHLALCHFQPRDWVNLKTWKTSSLQDQLSPKWKRPHLVILTPTLCPEVAGDHPVGTSPLSEEVPEPQPVEGHPGATDPPPPPPRPQPTQLNLSLT